MYFQLSNSKILKLIQCESYISIFELTKKSIESGFGKLVPFMLVDNNNYICISMEMGNLGKLQFLDFKNNIANDKPVFLADSIEEFENRYYRE